MNSLLPLMIFVSGIICNFSEDFYDNWLLKYREVSGKESPPRKYKEWIQATRSMGVSTDPSEYKKVFEQLEYVRETFKDISSEMVKNQFEKIMNLFPHRTDIMGLTLNDLMYSPKLYNWPFSSNFEMLSRVLDPSIDCFAIFQKFDEGMVIPSDDKSVEKYIDMKDVFRKSSLMRREWGDYQNKCIHLQAPTSFHVIPFDAAVFGINRLKGSKDLIFASEQTGILHYYGQMHYVYNAPEWEKKDKVAVFRGTSTGIDFVKAVNEGVPLTNNPRIKLHEMTILQREGKLKCSVKLDFGVTTFHINDHHARVASLISSRYQTVPSLDYEAQFKSKYLVVVDGHGWPDRIAFFLASGSLVFLATLHEDWTINQIKENEHYIKIKPDLSDLIEKLEWAAANDSQAKRIAQQGKHFAMSKLMKSNVKAYNGFLFMEYQSLFESK